MADLIYACRSILYSQQIAKSSKKEKEAVAYIEITAANILPTKMVLCKEGAAGRIRRGPGESRV